MEKLSTVPLSEFFGLFAPKYVVGTTYTASLAFFESVVLPKVDRSRLSGAVVIGDEFGFANATAEASALVDVTTTYSMVLAPHGKSFHAKVWVMATEEEFAVLCGSGNLTHSGFIGNHELFDVLRFRPGGDERELAEEITAFVTGVAELFRGFDAETVPAREILIDCAEAMRRVAMTHRPAVSREVFFVNSFGGSFPDQIQARTGNVDELHVAAPYFGGGYKGIDLLRARFPGAKLNVYPGLHGSAIDLPKASNGESRWKLKLWSEKKAFAHLKLYGFMGRDGAWLFNGSVNCTEQALSGANIEAGILRKVAKGTAEFYFEANGALPKVNQLELVWPAPQSRWLRVWAANTGGGIRLSLDPSDMPSIPLTKVRVELQSGSQSCAANFDHGFVRPVWSLGWSHFPKRPEGKNCLTVKITALDALGGRCEGVAFVDDTAMLTSSPVQRMAWSGIQSILTSEAIPSLAELGAVFELVGHVLEATEAHPNDASASGAKKSKGSMTAPEPIWPPQAGLGRGSGGGWAPGSDGWFQKMLDALLRDAAVREVGEDESADLDGNEAPSAPSEKQRRAAQKVFDLAKERIETFVRKVHAMTPDDVRAARIVPVAVGYFHLSQRAWKLTRTARGDAAEKDLIEFAAIYTRALFERRPQGGSYTPAFNSVYRHSIFPPLAWDIHHRFKIAIHASLVPFHLALFAFLRLKDATRFSRRQWLTFLSAAEVNGFSPDLKAAALDAALRLFVTDQKPEEVTAKLQETIETLAKIDWRSEPAYAALTNARQANRRIIAVDPHQRFCPNDGCPRIVSPEFDGLAAIGIVECPRCRSVLTPFPLHEAFLAAHAN